MMRRKRSALALLVLLAVMGGPVSCKRALPPSAFVNDSLKGQQLAQTKHRLLKQGAVGNSTGFTALWIPMSRPTESEARQDMVNRLKQEGINLKGLSHQLCKCDKGARRVQFAGFASDTEDHPNSRHCRSPSKNHVSRDGQPNNRTWSLQWMWTMYLRRGPSQTRTAMLW